MKFNIVFFGKKNAITPREHSLLKRFVYPYEVQLLPQKPEATLEKEAQKVLSLCENKWLVLLDETGKTFTSPGFAEKINAWTLNGTEVSFVIGSASGVHALLKERANMMISFGKMVWTYDLARLMLIEQLYRAQQILKGTSFHRD